MAYDVFVLRSQEDFDCLHFIYSREKWHHYCHFQFDPQKSFLNIKQFTYVPQENVTLVIDNTPFPKHGATSEQRITMTEELIHE